MCTIDTEIENAQKQIELHKKRVCDFTQQGKTDEARKELNELDLMAKHLQNLYEEEFDMASGE